MRPLVVAAAGLALVASSLASCASIVRKATWDSDPAPFLFYGSPSHGCALVFGGIKEVWQGGFSTDFRPEWTPPLYFTKCEDGPLWGYVVTYGTTVLTPEGYKPRAEWSGEVLPKPNPGAVTASSVGLDFGVHSNSLGAGAGFDCRVEWVMEPGSRILVRLGPERQAFAIVGTAFRECAGWFGPSRLFELYGHFRRKNDPLPQWYLDSLEQP